MAGAKAKSGGARPGSGGARVGAGRKPSAKTIFEREFVGPRQPSRTRRHLTDAERVDAQRRKYAKRAARIADARQAERQALGLKKYERTTTHEGDCAHCGKPFVAKLTRAKFCSDQCRIDHGNAVARDRAAGSIQARNCRECGVEFAPAYGVKMKMFCSESCSVAHKAKQSHQRKTARQESDPVYRLTCHMRTFINNALRRVGCTKDQRTEEILGCTPEAFRRHIERQFQPGMSWARRSEWHIDHIIPMAQAKDEAEAVRLNHYTNLRPLWAKDNMSKGAKVLALL